MELATIKMDPHAARKAFLEYRRAVHERHDQEDEEIMRGYRAAARGQQLLRLTETIKAGGTDGREFVRGGRTHKFRLPRLAVCRADAKICYTTGVGREGGIVFAADRRAADMHTSNRKDQTRMPDGTFEAGPGWMWGMSVRAIVPSVPPPLRPAHSLRGYHVLWEAEWALDPQPPVDPALLKHIGGDLYAVVAVWDLTELERAVLARRA